MRSNMMTLAIVVASVVLASSMATADDSVQEQLRLMEQRMAEMEDRLATTSEELKTAKATVDEQQDLLSDAGLVEGDDRGVRSGAGAFFEMVDISGVAAASYNYRFMGPGDNNRYNDGLFRHPNADTFSLDQIWITIDKTPTEESRGGFHADFVFGETAQSQAGRDAFEDTDDGSGSGVNVFTDSGLLYTGYASYLAPVGNGIQIDAGKLATPLGAEVIQTNMNFNVTQGRVFGLQPVTYVGVGASTEIADGLGFTFQVVNDVYSQTNADTSRRKAYVGQFSYAGDMFGLNVGAIVGKDNSLSNDAGNTCKSGQSCNTSVFDVVLSASPTDSLDMWINFDWVRNFGASTKEGDKYGLSSAGRFAVTDKTGIASRVEYLRFDQSVNGGSIGEVLTLTGTVDHELVEGLKVRGELRWDRNLTNSPLFANGSKQDTLSSRSDQLVGLAEIFYEF
jgi:hypothetical protein